MATSPTAEIALLLQALQKGEVSYLRAAPALLALREEAGIYANDPAFLPFTAINAALAELPLDGPPEHWSQAEQEHHKSELEALESWARELAEEACMTLVERYRRES